MTAGRRVGQAATSPPPDTGRPARGRQGRAVALVRPAPPMTPDHAAGNYALFQLRVARAKLIAVLECLADVRTSRHPDARQRALADLERFAAGGRDRLADAHERLAAALQAAGFSIAPIGHAEPHKGKGPRAASRDPGAKELLASLVPDAPITPRPSRQRRRRRST